MTRIVVVLLVSIVSALATSAKAQPHISFDGWTDGCDMMAPCPNGYFEGDTSASAIVSVLDDGTPCQTGSCLHAGWTASGADDFIRIRPVGFAPPDLSAWIQLWFYVSTDLVARLDAEADLIITIAHINTNTSGYYAHARLDSSLASKFEAAVFQEGRPTAVYAPSGAITAGWHFLEISLELPPVGTDGNFTIGIGLDDWRMPSIGGFAFNPGVRIVGAWGLGQASFSETSPTLGLDELCFTADEATASAACVPTPGPDGGVDGGPDTGVPADSATGDASNLDSSVDGEVTTDSRSGSASFRGGGGCACRASDGRAPLAPLLFSLLLVFALQRR